jgi:hypothetical protein
MTRAITLRLDDEDHAALQKQAERLRIRPGTLARMLVHAGLSGQAGTGQRASAHAALDRLVTRSHQHRPADAVALVQQARADPDTDR